MTVKKHKQNTKDKIQNINFDTSSGYSQQAPPPQSQAVGPPAECRSRSHFSEIRLIIQNYAHRQSPCSETRRYGIWVKFLRAYRAWK